MRARLPKNVRSAKRGLSAEDRPRGGKHGKQKHASNSLLTWKLTKLYPLVLGLTGVYHFTGIIVGVVVPVLALGEGPIMPYRVLPSLHGRSLRILVDLLLAGVAIAGPSRRIVV